MSRLSSVSPQPTPGGRPAGPGTASQPLVPSVVGSVGVGVAALLERRPRLLDLFCCEGGAADGYAAAGFEVVGVDIEPRPLFPFEFHQADAMDVLAGRHPLIDPASFDVIHASPPCQSECSYRRRGAGVGDGYEQLIPQTRALLKAIDLPYVIENVEGARGFLIDPVVYCGSSFGLDVRRHRLFESSVALLAPPCDHAWQTPRFPAATNRRPMSRRTVEVGVYRIPLATQMAAMGHPPTRRMTLRGLSESLPPAFTNHIGRQLVAALATAQEGNR